MFAKSAANLQQKSCLPVERPARPCAGPAHRTARVPGQAVLGLLQAPFEVARLDRADKGVDYCRYRARLAWRDYAAGQSRGDRLHRGGDVVGLQPTGFVPCGLSIGGSANLTVRSRHGGRIRSRHSRMAVGPPTSAKSIAFWVKASDPASSNAAAASVALFRDPARRPAGLPDRPFWNGRPRGSPGGFGKSPSAMCISLNQSAARSTARHRPEYSILIWQLLYRHNRNRVAYGLTQTPARI